jgi:hypothetical protein
MLTKQLSLLSLLLIAHVIRIEAMESNLGRIKTLTHTERDSNTPNYAEPVLAVFTQQPALTFEQQSAIKKWHKAHINFRKEWFLLSQTPEDNQYYKTKKPRINEKIKKNATPEGQRYLAAKKTATDLLANTPQIKIEKDIFILMPTEDGGCKLVLKSRVKYTQ